MLDTLMKEELSSSETSVLTRASRRNTPEETILRSHRRENLKSYIPASAFKMISYSIYYWTLKTEAIYSTETSDDLQRVTLRYTP
jgi:hypothetical protein